MRDLCGVLCIQCGQPDQEDNCRACGARIGGTRHTLLPTNAQMIKLVYVPFRAVPNILFVFCSVRIVGQIVCSYATE